MEAIENANLKNLISLLPVTFKFPSCVSLVSRVLVVRHVGFNGAPRLRACIY
jgi:hypothetical protein